ncbi:MAG: L-seryl-tRNA(Sec) selenium transferase, partial [Acidobacteriota bacterium]
NNAAAVLLILNTLALGKEVLVSRGELVEIGGSFRIPAIMERSGAILREVGTTNKTKTSDYREAIHEDTALILRVHPSNYRILGFTHRPLLQELVDLARDTGVPLVEDLGSGLLFSSSLPWLEREPTAESSLAEGVDLICFSGDKLLGGPQAGIIVGRKQWVDLIRLNPLMRACRADKMTCSALEWTLVEYEKGSQQSAIPVQRMLAAEAQEIRQRAEKLGGLLDKDVFHVEIKEGYSLIGGGSAPQEQIPTYLVAITSERYSVNELERHLRNFSVPIVARIEEDQLILDLRTVFPEQESIIVSSFAEMASSQ